MRYALRVRRATMIKVTTRATQKDTPKSRTIAFLHTVRMIVLLWLVRGNVVFQLVATGPVQTRKVDLVGRDRFPGRARARQKSERCCENERSEGKQDVVMPRHGGSPVLLTGDYWRDFDEHVMEVTLNEIVLPGARARTSHQWDSTRAVLTTFTKARTVPTSGLTLQARLSNLAKQIM
jgi:hypothetical protein